ncbi:MAG TPA: hypothetical protein VJ761_16730 [Ktedonobacteraceae bacterium]|nr:hypothetical protein [Ktedonobacteraceae bacterium]
MPQFESLIVGQPAILAGSMNPLGVLDPDAGTPNTIIETDDTWKIQISWSTSGLISLLVASAVVWHVKAFLDSMDGSPSPGLVGSENFDALNLGPNDHVTLVSPNLNYETTIIVPAFKVPEGLYKLNVAITTTVKFNNSRLEMAAFSEGSILQFYNP